MFVHLHRLEAIAADAELQEKSMTELQRLMTVLHEGCVQAEEEHQARYMWVGINRDEYMVGVQMEHQAQYIWMGGDVMCRQRNTGLRTCR